MNSVRSKTACYPSGISLLLQGKGALHVYSNGAYIHMHTYVHIHKHIHMYTTIRRHFQELSLLVIPSNRVITVSPQSSVRVENPVAGPQKCNPKYPDTSPSLSNRVLQSHSALRYPYPISATYTTQNLARFTVTMHRVNSVKFGSVNTAATQLE